MINETNESRVHLTGWPYITGTIIHGDAWCNKVTVRFDEGRTVVLRTDQLTFQPRKVQYLEPR